VRGFGPVVEIDMEKLWRSINYRLFRTSKTAKEVADVLGFSTQIFSDIKSTATGDGGRKHAMNYQPSGPIFLTICWWLDADPRDFYRIVRPVPISAPPAETERSGAS
jgi:hypothetical protein